MHPVTGMCQPWCPAMAPWAAPAATSGMVPVAGQGCAPPWDQGKCSFQGFCKENFKNRNYEPVLALKEGANRASGSVHRGQGTQLPAVPGEV